LIRERKGASLVSLNLDEYEYTKKQIPFHWNIETLSVTGIESMIQ